MPNSRRSRYIGDGLGHFPGPGAPHEATPALSDYIHHLEDETARLLHELNEGVGGGEQKPPEHGQADETLPTFSGYIHHLEDEVAHLAQELGEQGDDVLDGVTGDRAEPAQVLLDSPQQEAPPVAAQPVGLDPGGQLSLGIWGYYFACKWVLFAMGLIAFHALANLLFAGLVVLPVANKRWRKVKAVTAVVLALGLLYYDSWLPGVGTVIAKAPLLTDFNGVYLIELPGRLVSFNVIGWLLAACLLLWGMPRQARGGVLLVAFGLLLAQRALFPDIQGFAKRPDQAAAMPDMDLTVHEFFKAEAPRSVLFTRPAEDAVPFDVIFIHVCSLSWDDVVAAGLSAHPLWQRFDILLSRFNSAASYSGPAVIHLLRATCGQQPHDKLYLPASDYCYLMGNLHATGFEPALALNHDGKFDNFLQQIRKYGRLDAPLLSQQGLVLAQRSFDDSPVYDDASVLNRWLDERQKSASSRVALYYNTASLHDGNHLPGTDARPNTLQTYRARLARFLDEMDAFMQKMDSAGRRAVIVMVPEHGAALRGDKRQIAGLREIPTPAITIVPVGIRVVGGNLSHAANPLTVDQPTSYLAVAQIIERMLQRSPFSQGGFSPSAYLEDLPSTRFVSQNERTIVVESGGRYYFSADARHWEDYTEFNLPATERK